MAARVQGTKQSAWLLVVSSSMRPPWTHYCAHILVLSFVSRIVEDAERNHNEGMERLREAREFAQRSRQEHQESLPQLTDEQDRQLRKYLRLIEDHGWSKSIEMASRHQQMQESSSSADCVGCPVLNYVKNRDNNNEATK
jgi:hypothetical protein